MNDHRHELEKRRGRPAYILRSALLALVALVAAVPAATLLQPRTAQAAWSYSFESGKATFEVVPADKAVHATIECQIVNLDPSTASGDWYYYRWGLTIPKESTNVKVFDTSGSLSFSPTTGDYWTTLSISLRSNLFYGNKASFTATYDLALPNANQVDFYAWTPRGSYQTTIIVPKNYYEDFTIDPKQQSTQDLGTKTAYKYTFSGENYEPVTVEGARKGLTVTKYGSVTLGNKSVPITVTLWEGEDREAQRILDLYISALPVMEQITGVPFPPNYPVKVSEGTTTELKGYAGQNGGQNGIKVLWSSKTDSTLLHELAHYWAGQPPWAEPWMWEGQASLYAVMTLDKLGKTQAAADYREYRTSDYEDGKATYDTPLYDWKTPSSYTGQGAVSFGYGKSFIFMSNLQTAIGSEAMQKTNQTVFSRSTDFTWLDYMDALESTTGKEMRTTFFDWIVPKTFDTAITQYESVKSAVIQPKDRFGIDTVEKRLGEAKSELASGDVGSAKSGLDGTMTTLQAWQQSLATYRAAENISAGVSDLLGSGPFDDAMTAARNYLRDGRYDQSEVKGLEAKSLFGQWQGALKAYREAESTVARESQAMDAEFTSGTLDTAKLTLMRGEYSDARSQSNTVLALVPVWKDAVKAVRTAENDVALARSQGRTWQFKKVEDSLVQAQQMVASGDFQSSIPVSQATTDLAKRSMTPLRALAPYVVAGLAAIAGVVVLVVWLRRRREPAPA